MLIAGASGDPVDSALFIWQDVSKQVTSACLCTSVGSDASIHFELAVLVIKTLVLARTGHRGVCQD